MSSLCWLEQSQEKNECYVVVFEVRGSFFFCETHEAIRQVFT